MATTTRVTLEAFLAMEPAEPELELMDGEVLQKPMVGKNHSRAVSELIYLLKSYLRTNPIADVDTELRHLDRGSDWVFLPDVSVTLKSRLGNADYSANLPVEILPDFAIEVLSPDDRPGTITRKIARYMQAGVRLLWVVDPEARQLTAWRPGASPETFDADDTVSAAPVLPGFAVRVGNLCGEE